MINVTVFKVYLKVSTEEDKLANDKHLPIGQDNFTCQAKS